MSKDPTRVRESTLSRLARERAADRAEGRPQRGLFTGRGRASRQQEVAYDDATDEKLDDETYEDELDEQDQRPIRRPARRPRTGAKRTILAIIGQVPAYIRLLFGLMRDSRVSRVDRFFVLAAVAYIVSPLDLVPDLIPMLGQTDDIFLLVLALQRLLDNAGRHVVLDHWQGDPDDLSDVNLQAVVSAASFFLPGRIKSRLRRFARR